MFTVHRILKCEKVQEQRVNLGLQKVITEIEAKSNSDIEMLSNLTKGVTKNRLMLNSVNKCNSNLYNYNNLLS